MSVFEPKAFDNPPRIYRPLKIVHGLDRYLGDMGDLAHLTDDDPAGQWDTWVKERDIHLTDDKLVGIRKYLETLSQLGVGGIVTNVGFQDYLESPLQWEILRHGLKIAHELGLRIWLYDEKGYPSGTAAGKITRANPEFAALGLACYPLKVSGPSTLEFALPISCRSVKGVFATQMPDMTISAQGIDLTDHVDDWQVLRWHVPDGEWTVLYFAERYMYEGTHSQGNVSEFRQYVNLLNPRVTRAFLRVTHETYHRELPPDIWDSVEAIFTDEPSFMCYYVPPLPERYQGKVSIGDAPRFKDRPMAVPWDHNFNEKFIELKGYSLEPYYYALFFSESDEACYVRQDYYEVLTEIYAFSYYGQIMMWCDNHGISSSGHILLEENILDHVIFHGSLFAAIRQMNLPGLDMLSSDPKEMIQGGSFMGQSYMAVKQIASVAHLSGHERVHSESSDWEQRNQGGYATLQQRLGQANVQFVLGVNQITSYFGWSELGLEAQRHYNDYVGRLGSILTGGRHVCDVAVLYPVRTLWAHFLPPLKPIESWMNRDIRSRWEREVPEVYASVVKELLCSQIDLDIIDETALIEGYTENGSIKVGAERYRVIVCPSMDALSLDAAERLDIFSRSGGSVISVGHIAKLAESAENTPKVRVFMDDLFGENGHGYHTSLDGLVDTIQKAIPMDFSLTPPNPDVLYTHRVLEGRHAYFIVNNMSEPVVLNPILRETGPYTLFRASTGEVTVLSVRKALALELDAYEGAFVVCKAPS